MIKKFNVELFVFGILFLGLFFFPNMDSIFYDKLSTFSDFFKNNYLKNFFTNITSLGDSLWFFLFSITIFFCTYSIKKIVSKKHFIFLKKIQDCSFFLIAAMLVTGLLTQLIKHVVGRPRPNQVAQQNSFDLDYFNFESAFHSFPSGHTSTIFIVAIVFSVFTPKLKYFYFFFSGLVAFSRVVVGAHFLTDVVGGIVIAFIGYKITLIILKKTKIITIVMPVKKLNSSVYALSLVVFFIASIFTAVGSEIDIYFGWLFYEGEQQFFLQSLDVITIIVRKFILNFLIIYLLLLPLFSFYFPFKIVFFNHVFNKKDILFIFLSTFFNLLIVVNLFLKNFWGRARPNEVIELGGKEIFSPWYKISNACETNCSFVSGDSSVGFSLIILFFLTKNISFFWLSLFFGFTLGLVRIMEGGHFFSDILLSGLLIFVLSYLEYLVYQKKFI